MCIRLAFLVAGAAILAGQALAASPPTSPESASASASATAALAPDGLASWQRVWQDPVLDDLVSRALAANLDVEQAAARFDRANAAAASVRAALLPQLGTSASAAAIRQSLEDPSIRPFASQPGFLRDVERYEAGMAASWEIDLFGSAPRRRAGRASAAAAAADLAATRVAIAAETATAWINLQELRVRLALAEERLASLERQRNALRMRASAGTVAPAEVDRFEAETSAAAAAVPVLGALVTAQTERLGVLIADAAHARLLAAQPAAMPDAPNAAALSALRVTLSARPDVIAARLRLEAASATVAASHAQRLPRVQLSALLATIAAAPATLFSGPAVAAQASAGLAMPLFDFGRIDAAIAAARGAEREALAAFRQAMLQAAADVETAATAVAARQRDVAIQQEGARAAERALVAARRNHDAGISDLTVLLDVERSHQSATEAFAMAKAAHARAAVALFRATATFADEEIRPAT